MRASLSRGIRNTRKLTEGGRLNDEQARRVGVNEALFREVNEQIRGLNRDFDSDEATMTVICECADAGCAERLELEVAAYERIRGDSLLFVIAKGHEFPQAERIVEHADGYDVVRKREPEAAEIAEETDPRS
jgi:hypothetical protein